MKYAMGVDIGGSHITVAVVDMASKSLILSTKIRRRVDCHAAADAIISHWASAIEMGYLPMEKQIDTRYIGIAMPGPFEYEAGISRIKGFNKYEELYGLNIKELLGHALGVTPAHIQLKNDAACFLDGEIFAGAAKGGQEVLGITLGTGFGTAFGRNGRVVDAELSQTAFKNSRAEDYFSTKWFVDRAMREGGVVIGGVMELIKQTEHLALSKRLFEEFSANLAFFFEQYLSAHPRPDVVVIGGNIAHASAYFMDSVQAALTSRDIQLDIRISRLGESAALLGAASLWQLNAPLHKH